MAQTSYQRGQWFGIFSEDMCHGYVVRWDSSIATAFNGNGFYAVYQYSSTTPANGWNPSFASALVTCVGVQSAVAPTPVAFSFKSVWDVSNNMRHLTLNVPATNGAAAVALSVEVADADQRTYTRVVLGGNTSGIFSNVTLSSTNQVFSVADYGATGNGQTDDTAAINRAIAAAEGVGGSVYLPTPSQAYSYSSCLTISGISMYGDGDASLLQAANPQNSAVIVEGDHAVLSNLKITSPSAPSIGRQSTPQTAGVMINGATNFAIENVTINTTASVGIISLRGSGTAAQPSVISHCRVTNTLADGIHLTYQSSFINVLNNYVTNPGDDMFAVVSYMGDGGMCHDINVVGNYGFQQSANGRGASVVGGYNVQILNNNIQNTTGAGVYLQSELSRSGNTLNYKTYGDNNILVKGNVLTNNATGVHHGAINLGGRPADTTDAGQIETSPALITNVTIVGNTITNAQYSGISMQGYFDGISVEGNSITKTGQQGLEAFGGANLLIGDVTGNTFQNIGQYGIYLGYNSSVPTPTQGTVTIENNVFNNTNVLGTFAVPIISIGSTKVSGTIADNTFNPSGQYQISTPYVRFGVE